MAKKIKYSLLVGLGTLIVVALTLIGVVAIELDSISLASSQFTSALFKAIPAGVIAAIIFLPRRIGNKRINKSIVWIGPYDKAREGFL